MNRKMIAAALAATTLMAGSADAATFTKKYDISAIFEEGPISSLTASFVASIEDGAMGGSIKVTSFESKNSKIFSDMIYKVERFGTANLISIGGAKSDFGIYSGNDDFRLDLLVDNNGDIQKDVGYSTGLLYYSSSSVARLYSAAYPGLLSVTASDVTSAVPEPGIWALMLAGFGMIGAGLRYRRRAVKLRYA